MEKAKKTTDSNLRRYGMAVAGACLMVSSTAGLGNATPITNFGSAVLQAGNGSVVVSGNGTSGGCINWYNGGVAPAACPTAGGGDLSVQGGSTDPFVVGNTGTIKNLNFNTPFPVVDFIVVNNGAGPAFQFDLADIRTNTGTDIGSCSGAAENSPGVSCTPANSPFQITNGLIDPKTGTVDTVSVSFTVDAYGYENNSGTSYSAADLYIGSFTTQQAITDANIATILNTIRGGGSVSASWSATFHPETVTPEPATFLIFGAGLTLVGLYKRNANKS